MGRLLFFAMKPVFKFPSAFSRAVLFALLAMLLVMSAALFLGWASGLRFWVSLAAGLLVFLAALFFPALHK